MRPRALHVLAAAAALASLAAGSVPPPRPVVEAEVRKALASWSAGDERAALAELRRADENALRPRGAETVRRAKMAVARSLRRHPQGIYSFVRLEERAYSIYASERRANLAGPVRTLIPELVEEATGRRPSSAEREVAAALLTSFGGALHAVSQETGASGLYTEALRLFPRQSAALLGLAAIHEKRAEYPEALERLREAVAVDGSDREIRLRLALALLRQGHGEEGERELSALAAGGDDWVRSLAAQELTRRMLRQGDLASASAILEGAAAVLPCDPALPVQAAFVAERAGHGRPLDLGTLAQCGEASESARARYMRPPTSAFARLRQDLAAREPGWREALARGLQQ